MEQKRIIAFDSDGCVLNAMEPKHRYCFGPAAVEVYGLETMKDAFLAEWNRVNLYAPTRGINRFAGLVEVFENLRQMGYALPAQDALRDWCGAAPALSETLLEQDSAGNRTLEMALEWSRRVNQMTREIGNKIVPFSGAAEAVHAAAECADVAVVSSAREGQIRAEWQKFGIASCVKWFHGQESGVKAQCLAKLKAQTGAEILMVGDALGDLDAAQQNGLLFYPIQPGAEPAAWQAFRSRYLPMFRRGAYTMENENVQTFLRYMKRI